MTEKQPEIPPFLLSRLEDLASEVAFTAEVVSLIAQRLGACPDEKSVQD